MTKKDVKLPKEPKSTSTPKEMTKQQDKNKQDKNPLHLTAKEIEVMERINGGGI